MSSGSERVDFVSGNPDVAVHRGFLELATERTRVSKRARLVCIRSVPSTVSVGDVLRFLAPVRQCVQHMHVLGIPRQEAYMMLVLFSTHAHAVDFVKAYEGRRFSLIERDQCRLAFVTHVSKKLRDEQPKFDRCAICLGALAEAEGDIVHILCGHAFHGHCFSKCLEIACPVCRYSQVELKSRCNDCDALEDLWMCLTCGFIGCSRRQWHGDDQDIHHHGHSLKHSEETGHHFASSLTSQRVWDYQADRYVSHVGQNLTDHKLVALPGTTTAVGLTPEDTSDSLVLEYTYLLAHKLEEQRARFQLQLDEIENTCREKIRFAKARHEQAEEEYKSLTQELVSQTQELSTARKDTTMVQKQIISLHDKMAEEQEILNALRLNADDWKAQLAKARADGAAKVAKKDQAVSRLQGQLEGLFTKLG